MCADLDLPKAWRVLRKELALPSHTALVELAQERFTATPLASTAVRDGDQVLAWVTARRPPGPGKVVWVVVLNGAGDSSDPAIRAKVTAAITDLQAQTGTPAGETADAGWPSYPPHSTKARPGRALV